MAKDDDENDDETKPNPTAPPSVTPIHGRAPRPVKPIGRSPHMQPMGIPPGYALGPEGHVRPVDPAELERSNKQWLEVQRRRAKRNRERALTQANRVYEAEQRHRVLMRAEQLLGVLCGRYTAHLIAEAMGEGIGKMPEPPKMAALAMDLAEALEREAERRGHTPTREDVCTRQHLHVLDDEPTDEELLEGVVLG